MFASLRYIQNHHAYAPIENQPDQNPHSLSEKQNGTDAAPESQPTPGTQSFGTTDNIVPNTSEMSQDHGPVPDSPDDFQAALRELARDLVVKEQQIEYLITVLPGIGNSEQEQGGRIQALERELREVEGERKMAMRERDEMLGVLGELAAGCRRVY